MAPLLLTTCLLLLNLAAFAAFGIDKRRARTGGRRISEKNLLLFAILGGGIGAMLGRRHFRHKTRKASFSMALYLIVRAQVALIAWLLVPVLRQAG